MFKVIHPNRWFFWTIAVLVAVGLGLVFYIQQTSTELEQRTGELAGTPGENLSDESYLGWKFYKSGPLGFSVKYPPSWQIEIDPLQADTFFLENPDNFSENISISVLQPEFESVIRDSLQTAREEVIEIDGISGQRLYGVEAEDRAVSNVVLVENAGRLYYFAGSAKQFEKIVRGVKFLDE